MTIKQRAVFREGRELFTRIFMKFSIADKEPVEFEGDRIHSAQFHVIEAIGKGYGDTVTSLSNYFMITMGATSQLVTKLCAKGYIIKSKSKGNDKEIKLGLTNKGLKAFGLHESFGESIPDLNLFLRKYSEQEFLTFLSILRDIDALFFRRIEEENNE